MPSSPPPSTTTTADGDAIAVSLRLNHIVSRVTLHLPSGTLHENGHPVFTVGSPVSTGLQLRELMAAFCVRAPKEIELQYAGGDVMMDEDPVQADLKEVVAVVNVQQGASLTPFIPPAESLEKLLSASNFQLPDTSGSGAGTSAAAQASFMKIIADNPDFLQHAISTDPRMQHLMERNPQLRHALSDPSTMRDILSMATNRTAYTEMMRGHDRQLSNLENIPQGFQQLQQLYRDMDSTLGDTKALRSGSQTKGSGSWQPKKELVRKPMPNPWKKQPAASGMTEHAASAMPAPSAAIDGSTAMSASSPLLPPEQRFAAQLASMLDMGFSDREANMRALMACKGSMSMAIEWLLAHPSNSSTSSGAAKKSDNGNATTAGSKSETDTAPSDDKNVQARGSETGREEEK